MGSRGFFGRPFSRFFMLSGEAMEKGVVAVMEIRRDLRTNLVDNIHFCAEQCI